MLGNSIEEAKNELEKKIIFANGVFGIGTVFDGKNSFIEVSVKDTDVRNEIIKLLSGNKWQGHPVRIIIRDQTIR